MKKTAIIAGSFLFLFATVANAQTEPSKPAPAKPTTDQWNSHDAEKYKLQPMPEPITLEKKFPVIGKYNLTDKTGTESTVTITLDETNKGIVWVEGLPQGKIRAMLRKAPGTYKIPVQKGADDKNIAEGVLLFDKDANTLNVCIGCTYNIEDPTVAFVTPAEPVVDETVKVKTKKSTAKAKVTPVKTWKYSGNKVIETTASVVPMQ